MPFGAEPPPPPPRTDVDSVPPEPVVPPGPRGSKRAFHSFVRWLRNDSFHQQQRYCEDPECGTCAAWRRIAAYADAETTSRRGELQDHGFDLGRQVAEDAMASLAVTPPSPSMMPNTIEEVNILDSAIRQGFWTTVGRVLSPPD